MNTHHAFHPRLWPLALARVLLGAAPFAAAPFAAAPFAAAPFAAAQFAAAQFAAAQFAAAQSPLSYGQYYQQNVGTGPATNVNQYLYNRYFYHSPGVSPYLNMSRPGTNAATSYQAFVRPELERRQQATAATFKNVQQRKMAGDVGRTDYRASLPRYYNTGPLPQTHRPSPATGNPYFNQYFGSQNRGR